MNKVFIVTRFVKYESIDIIAVCSSFEIALKKAKDYIIPDINDWVCIYDEKKYCANNDCFSYEIFSNRLDKKILIEVWPVS